MNDTRPARVRALERFDYLVVGAGFAGCVLAERLASQLDQRVLIVDRRPHIGGNAYDHHDAAGLLVHRYGPHIFHTNSQRVVDYLSQFTAWRPYEHRVLAHVDDRLVPIPINLTTINMLYGLQLDEAGMRRLLAERAEPLAEIRTSRDVVVSTVGRALYQTFFEGHTRKQWGLDPSRLDKSVTARVPTRTDRDDRYFQDRLQQMPLRGYTRLFERMVDHPNIKVMLNTDFREVRGLLPYNHLILAERAVHPHHRIQAAHRPGAPAHQHQLRDPDGRGRPVLSGAHPRECRAVPALRGAGRPDPERALRRPPGHLPLLQHGPGGAQSLAVFQRIAESHGRKGATRLAAAAA